MNPVLRAAWLLLLLPAAARACDACGCSAAGPATLGLLPATTRTFIGLSSQYQSFRSTLKTTGAPASIITQGYTTLQVWGRLPLGPRMQLYAFLPYRLNTYQPSGGERTTLSGLGDASVLLSRVILRRPEHILLAGIGLKAPTGLHRSGVDRDRSGLPNSQPGTGAWDGQLAASYTYLRRRFGINAEASYTLTTANRDDYKYGNRLGVSAAGYLRRNMRGTEVLPLAGLRFEHLLHDYSRYTRRWLDRSTGGSAGYVQAGAQAYRDRLGASVLASVPVWQAAAGSTRAATRVEAGLTLFF